MNSGGHFAFWCEVSTTGGGYNRSVPSGKLDKAKQCASVHCEYSGEDRTGTSFHDTLVVKYCSGRTLVKRPLRLGAKRTCESLPEMFCQELSTVSI